MTYVVGKPVCLPWRWRLNETQCCFITNLLTVHFWWTISFKSEAFNWKTSPTCCFHWRALHDSDFRSFRNALHRRHLLNALERRCPIPGGFCHFSDHYHWFSVLCVQVQTWTSLLWSRYFPYGDLTIRPSDTHGSFVLQHFAALTEKWKINQETDPDIKQEDEWNEATVEVWMLLGSECFEDTYALQYCVFFSFASLQQFATKKEKGEILEEGNCHFSNTCFFKKGHHPSTVGNFPIISYTASVIVCDVVLFGSSELWQKLSCPTIQPSLSDCWSDFNNSTGRLWRKKLHSSLCSCAQPSVIRSPNYNHTLQRRHFRGP